jgi:hypothetical protein
VTQASIDPQEIIDSFATTAASGLARARFEYDTGWSEVRDSFPRWVRFIASPIRPIWRWANKDSDPGRFVYGGVIDVASQRCAMEMTHGPQFVVVGNRKWFGRPGDPLEEKEALPADTVQPLWLLGLLKGVVSASLDAEMELRGAQCRVFSVRADLAQASAATQGGLAPCSAARFEDLRRLPLKVAVDNEGRVRQVEGSSTFGETGNSRYLVELYDFGVPQAPDWPAISVPEVAPG